MLESFFFTKVAVLQDCNFIKKRFQHSCFPVNVAKFLRLTLPVAASTGASSKRGKEKHFIKRKIKISLNISLFESCFIKLRPITCNFVKIECPLQVFCSELCEISQNNFTRYSIERPLLDVKRSCGK